jgi:hypothetical protein
MRNWFHIQTNIFIFFYIPISLFMPNAPPREEGRKIRVFFFGKENFFPDLVRRRKKIREITGCGMEPETERFSIFAKGCKNTGPLAPIQITTPPC